MSISRVPDNDSNNLRIGRQEGIYPVESLGQNSSKIPTLLLNSKDASVDKARFTHSVGLLAGLMVFAVAMVIVVVALTCLAPGIPQSIILAIALSGVSLGGLTVMKNIVYKLKDKFSPHMSDRQRVKSALGVGLGFSVLGFAMRIGGKFIPGGYDAVVNKIGAGASSGGTSSLFTSLSHYLYIKYARSPKAASGEPLTRVEIMQEARKLHYISLSLLGLGIGFSILGVVLTIVGSTVLGGIPAAVVLVFAPPLISIGITSVLQTVLHSSVAKWKSFLEAQQKQELFVDSGLKNLRNEILLNEDLGEDKVSHSSDRQRTRLPGIRGIQKKRISSKEINSRLSLTTRQKVLFALSVLLVIAGFSAVIASGFAGMTALQILLVSTMGSAVASTVLPMASSGFIYSLFQIKARFKIALARRKESLEKRRFIRQLPKDAETVYTKEEIDRAWETVGVKVISDTEVSIERELKAYEKGRGVQGSLVAGILLACGVGIMLLTLVPTLAPMVSGILGIGSTLVAISGGIYLRKLSSWLFKQLVKLHNRLQLRKGQIQKIIADDRDTLVIDPVFEDSDSDDFGIDVDIDLDSGVDTGLDVSTDHSD